MTRDELLARLAGLRQARVGQVRVPHKPLLLLWLFGQIATTGSSEASYQRAEEPVSQLINDFGPQAVRGSDAQARPGGLAAGADVQPLVEFGAVRPIRRVSGPVKTLHTAYRTMVIDRVPANRGCGSELCLANQVPDQAVVCVV